MAINGTLQDFETQKFIESPTRVGKAVPEVTVGSATYLPSVTATNTTPAVTNVSAEILASNAGRKFAIIFNNSSATVYIKLGAAAVVNQGIRIAPNEVFKITHNELFTGAINAVKSTAASISLDVCEGT